MSDSDSSASGLKFKKFSKKFIDDTSIMMLAPLCWIGNKLELFMHLGSKASMTCDELAKISKCNPRYIQEWLYAMTCAEYVEYNNDSKEFSLPKEHKDFLVKGENNSLFHGDLFNAFRIFNESAPKYIDCFKNGGGLTLDQIHPEIGGAVEAFTGSTQKYRVPSLIENHVPDIHKLLEKGIVVADVGCGVGHSLISLAKKYPNSSFYGYEPHEASFLRAKANILDNFPNDSCNIFIKNETSQGMENNKFDFVMTWDVVHDLSDPVSFLKDIYRSLKDDKSLYLMNEVPASSNIMDNLNSNYTLAYSLSTMYCLTVSLANGGPGYGACMGEKIAEELCSKAGFNSFKIVPDCPSRLYCIYK